MQAVHSFFLLNLPIPVWHILLYIGLISFYLTQHKVRLSLVTSYLFILFWLYYVFKADLISVTRGHFLVETLYALFGFVLAGFGVFAYFFLEEGKEALLETLKKRDREMAKLKSKAKKAEKKIRALKTQAEEAQETLEGQESALREQLEAELSGRIDELEARLRERESLIEKREGEISDLEFKTAEAENRALVLERKVEEAQHAVHGQESALREQVEAELSGRIGELEARLRERESLIEKREGEIADLQLKAAEAENRARSVKTREQKHRQDSQSPDSSRKTLSEQELKHKLQEQLKESAEQLKYKDGLLALMAKRNGELADLKSKAEKRIEILEAQLKETRNGLDARDSMPS